LIAFYRFISFLNGTDACAPNLVTESDAAAIANRIASSQSFPSVFATVNAPQKVSPAAVVSTAVTYGAGINNSLKADLK
jgi:hypothetical protein